MNEIAKLGAILLIISGVCASILGFTNNATLPNIQKQIEMANNAARQEVLPDAKDFKQKDIKIDSPIVSEVYEGINGSEVVGYTIKTIPKGYAGPVEVMIGIGKDGTIKGVAIGNNTETPGLGTKAKDEPFKGQYKGKTTDSSIEVIKSGTPKENEISAIAGATITSKAVTSGVNEATKLYNEALK